MKTPGIDGLRVIGMAHGGEGIGRHDGKAVFVAGGIPGDVLRVATVETRSRFDRAVVVDLLEPSPDRVEPPCRYFGLCGGCQWQMASYPAQLTWKRSVVASQLEHLGRLEAEVLPTLEVGSPLGYRNRMDFRLVGGRPALFRARSHDPVAIADCLLLLPALRAQLEALGTLDGERVTLRAGANTGETAVLVDDAHAVIHEEVAGKRFVISGRTFFQVNTGGAAALVALVARALDPGGSDVLLDAYAGGGLFSATVGEAAGRVVAVESARRAVADLRINAPGADVAESPVERALGAIGSIDLAVVDPPRQGLGAAVVAGLAALGPRAIASVSCDPASFARDARLLLDAGYRLDWVQPVDMFPQTFHVEVVGSFWRA